MNSEPAKWIGGIAGLLIAGGFVDVFHFPIIPTLEFVVGGTLLGVLLGGKLTL
jgi:hypothetical protein